MRKTIKNIPSRIWNASAYSFDGLKNTLIKEESFRLEMIALVILLLVLFICPWPLWKKALMLACYIIIPLCELLNSAIEDICDLVSPGHNILIKNAKDKGSAAVLLAIIVNFIVLFALIVI